MAGYGYIKVYRDMRGHWIWENPQYFKWWVDLLFSANYVDKKILVNGELITIHRGAFLTSEIKLAEKWNTTRKTVRKFLTLLQSDGMVVAEKSRQSGTMINICNYKKYQDAECVGTTSNTSKQRDIHDFSEATEHHSIQPYAHQGSQAPKHHREHNEEIKELEEGKKGNKTHADIAAIRDTYNFGKTLNPVVDDWIAYKLEKNQSYKPRGLKSLLAQIQSTVEKYGADAAVHAINESMASNYQGIVWAKAQPPTTPLYSHAHTHSSDNHFLNVLREMEAYEQPSYYEEWGEVIHND